MLRNNWGLLSHHDTLRFGVGALVGILVNLNPPESPLPMAITRCGFGSALCYWLLTGKPR